MQGAKTMKALRVERGATEAVLKKIEIPKCGPQDVLVKVESAILAPDVFRLVEAGILSQAPTTIGHKIAGMIAEVGVAVKDLEISQRVRVEPNLRCGNCVLCTTGQDQMCAEFGVIGFFSINKFCAWEEYHAGGLAEYICVPASQIDVLPENVSFDVGAKIHDLANAVQAFRKCELQPGSTVLITAATGAMGTSCVILAKFFGVAQLILVGRSTERLEEVAQLAPENYTCAYIGLDSLDEDWPSSRTLGRKVKELAPEGVDAIIDYSPEGVDLLQVIDGLRFGGTLIPLGGNRSILPISMRTIGMNCWRVLGTRNHNRRDTEFVLNLLKTGELIVDGLVSHEFKLEDIDAALRQLKNRSKRSWMLVIRP